MNIDLAASAPPSPALLEARAALAAQQAALGAALVRLERARALVPPGDPGDRWRGPAQALYRRSVLELAQRLDEAVESVRAARRSTNRAAATMASRD